MPRIAITEREHDDHESTIISNGDIEVLVNWNRPEAAVFVRWEDQEEWQPTGMQTADMPHCNAKIIALLDEE